MPKYLCVQRNLSDGSQGGEQPSPAQMQEMYAKFTAWKEKFADHIVDLGGKLGSGKLVTHASADGPFVEVKELVGGFMVLSAESLDEAIEVARALPGLVRPGSGVEVIEIHTS